MKVFLDDDRAPWSRDWLAVRNVPLFQQVMWLEWDNVEAISFDNDLGTELEGYDAAKWLANEAHEKGYWPPKLTHIYIHTGNGPGADNIRSVFLNRFAPDNLVVRTVDPPKGG